MAELGIARNRDAAPAGFGAAVRNALSPTTLVALLLAAVLVFLVANPLFQLVKDSFTRASDHSFTFANYVTAFGNKAFQTSVGNNVLIVVLSLFIQIPFSLALAVLLNRRFRGRAILRLLFFLPYVLSEAVTGIVFTLMLQPDSVLDTSLKTVGLEGLIQDWLGDSTLVMVTLFVIISWKYFGFHMIIMLAGLQGIPKELEEAALIDGADRRQSFRYVTLPLLGPTIRIWAFLSMIGALQLFDLVYIIWGQYIASTAGTSTMATYMVANGRIAGEYGYGNAVAVVLFFISLAAALIYQRFVLRRDTEGAITGGRT